MSIYVGHRGITKGVKNDGADEQRLYGGQTQEERKAKRRRQLLDAALEVFGTEGVANATARGVCVAANLTPRYLYEEFENLDQLARELYTELAGQTVELLVTAIAQHEGDVPAMVDAGFRAGLDFVKANPHRAAVMFTESQASGPLAQERVRQTKTIIDLIGGYGMAAYGDHLAASSISQVTSVLLAGGISEIISSWLRGDLKVDEEQLVNDLTILFLSIGNNSAQLAEANLKAATK